MSGKRENASCVTELREDCGEDLHAFKPPARSGCPKAPGTNGELLDAMDFIVRSAPPATGIYGAGLLLAAAGPR